MPKIRIREIDLTTAVPNYLTDNVIFIPGITTTSTDLIYEVTASNMEDDYVNKPVIETIIGLGGKVLSAVSYETPDPSNAEINVKELLKDKNQYDIKFLFVLENIEENAEQEDLKNALEIASARKDCAVILVVGETEYQESTIEELTKDESSPSGDPDADFYAASYPKKLGKYVIPFYANNLKRGEKGLNAGLAYFGAFLQSRVKNNTNALAIAGASRGAIPFDDLTIDPISEATLDVMQTREASTVTGSGENVTYDWKIAINPIINMEPWGIRIWGNRTALPNVIVENADPLVITSFANIRIAICDIRKHLYKVAKRYQFEQNSDILWINFTSEAEKVLEALKDAYVLSGYRWKRKQAGQRAKINGTLQLSFIAPVEDFDLTLELSDIFNSLE